MIQLFIGKSIVNIYKSVKLLFDSLHIVFLIYNNSFFKFDNTIHFINEKPITKVIVKYEDKYKEYFNDINENKEEDYEKICDINKNKLDSLINSILIENTPLGNVLMFYNSKRSSFEYYSNSTIPYRYLETIARSYVLKNDCKYLYINMDVEINKAKQKIKLEEEKEKEKENEKKKNEENDDFVMVEKEKSVFAKFKDYNKITKDSSSVPRKNSAVKPGGILKEKANRFSYEGKMNNYDFIKKVPRKVVDKHYSMTYSDYKKSIMSVNI
jgi:hypothetical protein